MSRQDMKCILLKINPNDENYNNKPHLKENRTQKNKKKIYFYIWFEFVESE